MFCELTLKRLIVCGASAFHGVSAFGGEIGKDLAFIKYVQGVGELRVTTCTR